MTETTFGPLPSDRMTALIDRALRKLPAYAYPPRRTDHRPTWTPTVHVLASGGLPQIKRDLPPAMLADAKGRLLPRRVRRERRRQIDKKVAQMRRMGIVTV